MDLYLPLLGASMVALIGAVLVHRRLRRAYRSLAREAAATERELASRLETEEKLVQRFRSKVHTLKDAMEHGAIESVYQPVVDLSSGDVIGTEALARFSDGRAPEVWFKEAAELDIICELEMAAIDRAFVHLDDLADGFIAVNVSPATISYPSFLSFLMRADIPSDRIVVELTEHAVVENYDIVRSVTDKLKRLGVRIAVDDVGAGFSNFRHVLQLRPDIVKLDRSLISGIHEDNVRLSLVSSLVGVAERMNASVVAEGIEVEGEVNALWSLGIEMGQGFLFCRPSRPPLPEVCWHPVRATLEEEPVRSPGVLRGR